MLQVRRCQALYRCRECAHQPVNPWVFNVRATYQREAERAVRHLSLIGRLETRWCGKPGVAMRLDIESVARRAAAKAARVGRQRSHESHAPQLSAVNRADRLLNEPLTA